MVWFDFIHCVLFSLHFVSHQCEGAIISPPNGERYLFLPGETEKIKWEFDDPVSAVQFRSWSYRGSKGATARILARISVNGSTEPQTNLFDFAIERPATLVLKNINQSYNGIYQFGYIASETFSSEVVVSIANAPIVKLSCPSRNEVNESDNFTCVCRGVGGNPPANVTWFKDGVQISETKQENNTLNLYDVNGADSGNYTCVAQSYPTEAFKDEKSRELIVRSKPYDTTITFNPQPAIVGDSVEIMCDSKGFPVPHFNIIRNGKKIQTGKSHTLRVNQSDEGPYTCIAINTLGNDSATDNLTVTGPMETTPIPKKPSLTVTMTCPRVNKVNEGDNFTCTCRCESGNPPANVTWHKGGVQIGETGRENKTLTLTDVDATDSGTYTCVVQLSYPTEAVKDEKSIELTVHSKTFSDDNSCGTEWYIVVVSLVSGIIIGIIFSYIVWCSHRCRFRNRKPERNLEPQPIEVDTTYQELDLTRMNTEDNYQSLRVNAASNVAGNDDDSTYTELSKTRDVENNYQSLT